MFDTLLWCTAHFQVPSSEPNVLTSPQPPYLLIPSVLLSITQVPNEEPTLLRTPLYWCPGPYDAHLFPLPLLWPKCVQCLLDNPMLLLCWTSNLKPSRLWDYLPLTCYPQASTPPVLMFWSDVLTPYIITEHSVKNTIYGPPIVQWSNIFIY